MAVRTVSKRTDEQLLREYNALFTDKTVQKVMRYLAVREELLTRHSMKKIRKLASEAFKRDSDEKGFFVKW